MKERGREFVEGARGVFAGFKEFISRGNVMELAIAVVVGTAFTNIVNSVVEGVINPLVGAFGTQDLEAYESCLRGPCEENAAGEIVSGIPIRWGSVISASLTFLITAAVVYFLMFLPLKRIMDRRNAAAEEPAPKTELDLLTEIRDELIAQRTGAAPGADQGGNGDSSADAGTSAGAGEAGASRVPPGPRSGD